jgi:dipeptidyl aminopeptidase/acylaminoacyl peptidase
MVDAVQWAVAQKLAPAGQICIFGASYGGYAALQAPRVAPGTFKCAIGYAGVYDLPMLVRAKKDVGSENLRRFFARTLGTDTAALAKQSPARAAAEVGVPVFLIHGKDDENARLEQYEVMKDALAAAGKPAETFIVAGEGHGFYSADSRAELYRRLEAFLAKHIPVAP